MPTEADLHAMRLYQAIMEEVKIRALSINGLTANIGGLPPPIVRESCFLQLRMVCELTALGCLVAHGDIEATKTPKLQKAYQADDILNALERMHPEFFPAPVVMTTVRVGHHHFDNRPPDFLTKQELLSLYHKCGRVLHRGSVRGLIKPQMPHQGNFPDVEPWAQKILNLLSVHRIVRIGNQFVFIARLDEGGVVKVSIVESFAPTATCLPVSA